MKTTHYLGAFAAALFCGACTPQAPVVQPDPASTVVNEDGTVTFSYRNDNAQLVEVDVQFAGKHAMQRDSVSGLWTVTLGPAAPDMYPYHFVVDGMSVMDPGCDAWFPNEGFKNSLLDIPGKEAPLIHSLQNVPHGCMEYVHYYSEAIGAYNNAVISLPPSYYQEARDYPVFYLISGTTDTEDVYHKVGRINYILDNLYAHGQASEMIVVLPYGNPAKLTGPTDMLGSMNLFGQDLINDLMPYVESHYRTRNTPDQRAIGGFSRGGNQALSNGLMNLDKFSYLCSYSSFTTTDLPKVYNNAKETNSKIHLFWAGVGTDDFLYGTARDYTEFLDKKGITCVKEYTDDKFGHTWMNAKYFLSKTLPLLFNPAAAGAAMCNAQPTKEKTGQEPNFTPGVMARLFPKPIISPECMGDSVTFRLKAPAARKVEFNGEMLEAPVPMTHDTTGIWSLTLKVTPDVYCYNFIVDGTPVCDAQNMYLAPEKGFKRSVLNMPGDPFAINNVRCEYSPVRYSIKNNGQGGSSRFLTITPNVFSAEAMPTITLVSSPEMGYTYESWYKIAHANLILDQLIAQGQCKPCILQCAEQEDPTSRVNLRISDYKSWAEARAALVETLKAL